MVQKIGVVGTAAEGVSVPGLRPGADPVDANGEGEADHELLADRALTAREVQSRGEAER